MEQQTGSNFQRASSIQDAVNRLQPGERGIVYVAQNSPQGPSAHVFNAAKDSNGNVRLYDGQANYTTQNISDYQTKSGYTNPYMTGIMITGKI